MSVHRVDYVNYPNAFFCVPHLANFISFFIEYVIACIAYIHPTIQSHDHLDKSLLP